jgi:hypothetical protein
MSFIDFFDNPKSLPNSNTCGINKDQFHDDNKFLRALKEEFSE